MLVEKVYIKLMCGRFYRHEINADLQLPDFPVTFTFEDGNAPAAYNIAPTQSIPIWRASENRQDFEIVNARWGLVPYWYRKPLQEFKLTTFNARSEKAHESNVFKQPLSKKRCIIPASGFYEWMGEKGNKQPVAISLKNRRHFFFAGLWDKTTIDGEAITSCTIMTTEPNAMMKDIHNRMPVIIGLHHLHDWLFGGEVPEGVFEPYDSGAMTSWPVGKAVGNVRNQGAELINEVALQ